MADYCSAFPINAISRMQYYNGSQYSSMAHYLSLQIKSAVSSRVQWRNLQAGFMAAEKSWRQRSADGKEMKRGFLSSCLHHHSTRGCRERQRIMAARGGVNLQDLFSLMRRGLTINLNHPRRKRGLCTSVYMLAGVELVWLCAV